MTKNLKIKRLPYSKLMKAEIGEFAKKTLGIALNHEPEVLLIEPVTNQLEALMPEIELLSLRYGVDPVRLKVDTLRSKLMLTVSGLKLKVRLVGKDVNDPDMQQVKNTMDVYLRYLSASRNDKVLSDKISGFIKALDVEELVLTAFNKHNLMSDVDAIKMAHVDFELAVAQRVNLLSERPKIDTKVVLNKIVSSVENLFKTIEVGSIINPELDYVPLANELNQLVKMFRLSIIIRLANNKRNADKEKAHEEGSDVNVEDMDGATSGAAPMVTSAMYSAIDWDDDEDNITPVELLDNPVDETDAEEHYNDEEEYDMND